MNCCSCNDIVGYRFHPTDKELIDHYLWNKALDRDSAVQAIGEVVGDLSDWEPEELSRFSVRRSNDQTWYLFSQRNHSKRVKRKTKLGYWKLTGKNRRIKANVGIGTKKTLVFYEGRFSKGKWTPWVIHEYTLPSTLPNQKGVFLCKLRRKDDEKAGISSYEEGQPSNAGNDKIFDNSLVINVDELLALLGETNGSNEVQNEVASAQKPQMYGEQGPSCNAASFLYNPGDDFDGVQNQSSTNEQDDELYPVSSMLQSQMHGENVPCCNDLSFFCGSNQHQSSTNEQDDEMQCQPSTNEQDDEMQHQPSTNEQDDDMQHQPSTNEQDDDMQCQPSTNEQDDEMQHQPSTNEQDDEFWNHIFANNDDDLWNHIFANDDVAYPDERSNELFVGSESSDLLVGRNIPIESSRKRPRIDDVGLNDVTKTEESQAREGKGKEGERLEFLPILPFLLSFHFLLPKHVWLRILRSFDEAPNITLFAVDHNLHSSERRVDILNEKMSVPSFDFVADVTFICSPKYSIATRMYSPQNQQKPSNLIVKEPNVKGIPVQWKFFRKMASADKVRGIEEDVTAMDISKGKYYYQI